MSAPNAQALSDACHTFAGHLQTHHTNLQSIIQALEGQHLPTWIEAGENWIGHETQKIQDEYMQMHQHNLHNFLSWLEAHPNTLTQIGQKVLELFNEVVPD